MSFFIVDSLKKTPKTWELKYLGIFPVAVLIWTVTALKGAASFRWIFYNSSGMNQGATLAQECSATAVFPTASPKAGAYRIAKGRPHCVQLGNKFRLLSTHTSS